MLKNLKNEKKNFFSRNPQEVRKKKTEQTKIKNKMADLSATIPMNTLNVNGLNTPSRDRDPQCG